MTTKRVAFSTTTKSGGSGRKMQKLFIDYLDDAARKTEVVKNHGSASRNISSLSSSQPPKQVRKMQKLFIEYLDDAAAKIAKKDIGKPISK